MQYDREGEPGSTDDVELVSDGENLLVVGKNLPSAENFLRSRGLLENARRVGRHQVGAALGMSAHVLNELSGAVAESSLWLKMTPESAKVVRDIGLTDTKVQGVAYAMVGVPGKISDWIKVDVTRQAQLSNPGVLSGAAGLLSQVARQHEAAQLRAFLGTLDQKLDEVIRGQQDDVLGDLAGIEQQIQVILRRGQIEGEIDSLAWSTLSAALVGLRQVQAKAVLKVHGIASDLEEQKRFVDLNERLRVTRGEVPLWLSVVARCVAALDELAILELDYCAQFEPHRLGVRRETLNTERDDDRVRLTQAVGVLVQRMVEAARTANTYKLFHWRRVPEALGSIEATQAHVKRAYDALGLSADWQAVDPIQWRDALVQPEQWRNGLQEGGSLAWEKGKPAIGLVAVAVVTTAVNAAVKSVTDDNSES